MLLRNLRRYDMRYEIALVEIPKMMNGDFPPDGGGGGGGVRRLPIEALARYNYLQKLKRDDEEAEQLMRQYLS